MNARLAEQLQLLPELLSHHLQLTLIALGIGIALSIPAALLAVRFAVIRGPLLTAAGVVQTIPSLALLALMVPLLGMIGFVPAMIALILYSILPILRNTVTGILAVDPALIEAARGVGMTGWQMMRRVQLPLAAPVIIAGIRTATVWVVGIATLSTPVGAKSLGNYIFGGLQTQNQVAVIVGCVSAAVLAVVLDLLIRLLELSAERRSRAMGLTAAATLGAVLLAGLWPLARNAGAAIGGNHRVVVASKTFTEQYILADVIATRLQSSGFDVDKKPGMGSKILFDSLANGSVDCYVDYSGTIWATVMKREQISDRNAVMSGIVEWLRNEHGIVCLGRLGFENTYALAMPRARAEELGIRTIDDLQTRAATMKIGGDYEFFSRDEWKTVQQEYGLQFAETVALNGALMYSAAKEGLVDLVVAFSTDGRIAAYDLVVLEDTKGAFPPYDAVLLLSRDAARDSKLVDALTPLIDSIDDDAMRNANKLVDLDGRSTGDAARELLRNE